MRAWLRRRRGAESRRRAAAWEPSLVLRDEFGQVEFIRYRNGVVREFKNNAQGECRGPVQGRASEFSPLLFLTWLVFGIPAFVRGCWVCELAGIRCRRAGSRRLTFVRKSPGVGVNRRSHTRRKVSKSRRGREVNCARNGRGFVAVRASIRMGEARVLDSGERLGKWKGKCLQRALVKLCRGDLRARMAERLKSECANDFGSGCLSRPAKRNLMCSRKALLAENLSVVVLSSPALADASQGVIDGAWDLGSVSYTHLTLPTICSV